MPGGIDELLEAMFRNGTLNIRKSDKKQEEDKAGESGGDKLPSLEWDPNESAKKTDEALRQVQNANAAMSKSLQADIERLTRETQEQLKSMENRLKEDGITESNTESYGDVKDIEAAFEAAKSETLEKVLGQEDFVSALAVAFKRPFIAGKKDSGTMGCCAVMGRKGTGRHTALSSLTEGLARRHVLKSPKLTFMDLSSYSAAETEKLFRQDLYAAVKGGASALVFENFEDCHPSVLTLVSSLFKTGEAPLSGRYAEQKGVLVDIGGALVPNVVSSISAKGKYLFILTDKNESRLADAFGMPFLSALDDMCETQPLSEETIRRLSENALKALCGECEKRLGISLSYGQSAVDTVFGGFIPDEGALSLTGRTGELYRALSEHRLHTGAGGVSGRIEGEGKTLCAELSDGTKIHAGSSDDLAAREAAIKAVKEELSEIVGLEGIKSYILSLEDNFKIQQLRREKGLRAESPSMHMIFTGNPGTGKTTVARIVSRYLKAIGVLSGGQLVEVTRADLVGRYVGHTAPLTQKAIQSAIGGVLFVDEAYSLYRGRDDSFGLEAIDTLVKGMEDNRDELVVILAGYSKEMEEFLTANSGLKSRFPNIIEFPDYSARELLDITKSIVRSKGYKLSGECDEPLLAYFDKAQKQGDSRTNGNGRMARNKVEDAILNCSRRNLKAPEADRDLETLLLEDFELD